MKKALCIGINDYPGYANDLNGCVNDAEDWTKELRDNFGFEVTQLLDRDATKGNILSRLTELVNSAKDGDILVLTYSGHGTQVYDNNADEDDGYDEALYVYDGTIIDDEFRTILNKVPSTVSMYVILDSCFSGTMTRFLRPVSVKRQIKFVQTAPRLRETVKTKLLSEEDITELLLTGCTDDEFSYDAFFNGRYNGAMTYYALDAIRKNREATWKEMFTAMRDNLPSIEYPQTPQLEGKEEMKNQSLFGGKEIPDPEPPPVEEPDHCCMCFILVLLGIPLLYILIPHIE